MKAWIWQRPNTPNACNREDISFSTSDVQRLLSYVWRWDDRYIKLLDQYHGPSHHSLSVAFPRYVCPSPHCHIQNTVFTRQAKCRYIVSCHTKTSCRFARTECEFLALLIVSWDGSMWYVHVPGSQGHCRHRAQDRMTKQTPSHQVWWWYLHTLHIRFVIKQYKQAGLLSAVLKLYSLITLYSLTSG